MQHVKTSLRHAVINVLSLQRQLCKGKGMTGSPKHYLPRVIAISPSISMRCTLGCDFPTNFYICLPGREDRYRGLLGTSTWQPVRPAVPADN